MAVYRVTVRGRFKDLTAESRAFLAASVTEHDLGLSGFTAEGTLTFDGKLDFFNLRYEVRVPDGAAGDDADPSATALREAALFLHTLRIGHGPLRAAVMDMSEMADRAQRRRHRGRT